MKKQILIIGTFLTFGYVFSQNTFPTGAGTNVGIGTTTPSTSLQITSATSGTSGIRLTNLTSLTSTTSGNSKALSVDSSGNIILTPVLNTTPISTNIYNSNGTLTGNRTITLGGNNITFNSQTSGKNLFVNGTTGRVGIGCDNPTSNLDVDGGLTNGVTFSSEEEKYQECLVLNAGAFPGGKKPFRTFKYWDIPESNLDNKSQVHLAIEDRDNFNRLRFVARTNGDTWFGLTNRLQEEIFTVYEDGSDDVKLYLPKANSFLGIGTSNFTDGSDIYRLSVKGAIRADRVKVYTTWADFVFEKSYTLPTLEEVEEHIKKNGHLKDIPSATEVETNGIELGEMNKKLLQKVEELTLYVIQLNKELKEVKVQLNQK